MTVNDRQEPVATVISDELRQALLGKTDAMGRIIADEMPPPRGCDDWEYRDLPWMDPKTWNLVFSTVGKGNVHLIAFTQKVGHQPPRRRGQFWISPEGCARLKELAAGRTH